MRILLVDDDPALRELLRTTFEVVAVEVAEAEDAATARRYLMRAKPDVIVLDVRMPGEDGLSLCRAVKDNPEWRGIGVVLLTGSDQGGADEASAAGADAFLRKPFSPLELLGVVERLSNGRADGMLQVTRPREAEEQLTLYAKDLRRLLEIERGQRILLESAYQETVARSRARSSPRTPARASTPSASSATRWSSRARCGPSSSTTPAPSTAFCSTTSGRSACPTRSSRSPGRSPTASAA